MSTTPRVPSAIPGEAASLRSALAHSPDLALAFHRLYGTLWSGGIVDQATKETARMRNARVTDCGFCKNVRFDGARESGLTEDMVDLIHDGYETSELSDDQKLILRYTDAFLRDPANPAPGLTAQMSARYTPAEIVEITLALTMFLGMAKVLISLGTEPEEMSLTVVATPALIGSR